MFETLSVVPVPPVLLTVNTWVATVVVSAALLTRALPKLALAGFTLIVGAVTAVPVAVRVPSEALLEFLAVIVQLLAPVEVGVSVTVTVWVLLPLLPFPTVSGSDVIAVIVNSLQLAGPRSNELMVTGGLALNVVVAALD